MVNSENPNDIDWFTQVVLIKKFMPNFNVALGNIKGFKTIEFSVSLPYQQFKFDFMIAYKPKFKYGVQLHQPLLFCKNNDIIRHIDAHINIDGQICYFYPGDLSYKSGISCLYAIQAAIKWADCYNYWIHNKLGGWPCSEMPHGSYAPASFEIHRPLLF
jgi:hypothetical protein